MLIEKPWDYPYELPSYDTELIAINVPKKTVDICGIECEVNLYWYQWIINLTAISPWAAPNQQRYWDQANEYLQTRYRRSLGLPE